MVCLRTFRKELLKLHAPAIQNLSRACGGGTTGRKQLILDNLYNLCQARMRGMDRDYRLISIDLGLKNIGVCQILVPAFISDTNHDLKNEKRRPVVEKWFRTALGHSTETDTIELTSFTYPGFSDATIAVLRDILKLEEGPVDAIIVERQRSRSAGSANIPNNILRLNVVEGMVNAGLRLMKPEAYLESIIPQYVVRFWQSDAEKERLTKKRNAQENYALAKKARRSLVEQWLKNPQEVFNTRAVQTGVLEIKPGKKDDKNDALVQAISWMKWRDNSIQLIKNVEAGYAPAYGLVLPCDRLE